MAFPYSKLTWTDGVSSASAARFGGFCACLSIVSRYRPSSSGNALLT
jgi:hypothetical protein